MNNVPSEIVLKIFGLIDSTAVLATCRRVCKLWNKLGAMILFDRLIDLSTEQKAWTFFDCLLVNPDEGKWVKRVDFGCLDGRSVELKRRILKLIFTCNMDIIQGYSCQDSFFLDMITVAKNDVDGKWSLQAMPHPAAFTDGYKEACMLFSDSLQDVYYDTDISVEPRAVEAASTYLNQFQNLTSLAIGLYSVNALSTMLDILGDFRSIEDLAIYASEVNNNSLDELIRDLTTLPSPSTKSAIKGLKIIIDIPRCIHFILQHFSNSLKTVYIRLESDTMDGDALGQVLHELDRVPCYVFQLYIDATTKISLRDLEARIQSRPYIRLEVLNKHVVALPPVQLDGFRIEEEFVSYSIRLERQL